jgi:tetratricopeptide (TPR) repeat protein
MKNIIYSRALNGWLVLGFCLMLLGFRFFQISRLPLLLNVTLLKNGMNGRSMPFLPSSPSSSLQARALAQLDSAQAETWLAQGVEGNGRSLTYFELCRLYWQEGRQDEAVAACQAGEISATYWVNVGLAAEQDKDFELALRAYETAVAVDPLFGSGWFRLGHIHFQNHSYIISIQYFEEALRQNYPPNPGLYSELGHAYIETGNAPQALVTFEQGLTLFPQTQYLFLDVAAAYRSTNNFLQADHVYEQTLEIWPEDARVWALRGDLALKENQSEQALAYYEQAVFYDPQDMGHWFGLATVANGIGKMERAAQAYEEALQLAPNHINIALNAGQFFLTQGNSERAKAIFEHILQLEPNNQQAQEKLNQLTP